MNQSEEESERPRKARWTGNTGNNTGPASSFPDHEVTGLLKRHMSASARLHHNVRKQTTAWWLVSPHRLCGKKEKR